MARSNNNLKAVLQDTADAIRAKKSTSEPIVPRDFADEIESIQSGGGDNFELLDLLTGNLGDYVLPERVGTPGYPLRVGAFEEEHNLHEIDFKNETFVPNDCCRSCTNLQFADGSNVTVIENIAFQNCSKLEQLNFPNLEFIWVSTTNTSSIFYNCRKLSQFSFSKLINLEGAAPFGYCSLITSLELPNLVRIGKGSDFVSPNPETFMSSLSFPELVFWDNADNNGFRQGGARFNSIYAPNLAIVPGFSNCAGITELSFPYAIAMYYSIASMTNLETINMPFVGSVTNNGAINMGSCPKLKEAFFPFFYGQGNFANDYELSIITMGASYCPSVQNCSALESIYILWSSTKCASMPNVNYLLGTPMSNSALLGHFGSIYVPSDMLASYKASTNWINYSDRLVALPSEYERDFIYTCYMSNSNITELPSDKLSAKYVLASAFHRCVSLQGTISLPNCLGVGISAFVSCPSIRSLYLPECLAINTYAFSACNTLNDLTLPKVRNIGSSAFNGIARTSTYKMSLLSIPECRFIGSAGFQYAFIQSIYAPELRYADLNAFMPLQECEYFYAPKLVWFDTRALGTTFSGKTSLRELSLPKLKVGGIFGGTSYLTSASLPELLVCYNYLLHNCPNLETVYAPKLFGMGDSCFYGCTKLSHFNFRKMRIMGNNCFANTGLLSAALWNFEKVPLGTFGGCVSLSALLLPMAFELTGVGGCTALESLYMFASDVCSISASTVLNGTKIAGGQGSIFVPAEFVSKYQADANWSWFSSQIVGLTHSEMLQVEDGWQD